MYFHASQIQGIEILKPHLSEHGMPLVYFSTRRENVLVYLSNAVEKYCRETGFDYNGTYKKWGPYGFDADGRQQIEEYYPDAYDALLAAEKAGLIRIVRYDEWIVRRKAWLERVMADEYKKAGDHPEYRHFLKGKFGSILCGSV